MPEAVVAPRTPGAAPFGGSPEGAATAAIDDDSDSSQDGNSEDGEANIAPDGFREGLFYESGDDLERSGASSTTGSICGFSAGAGLSSRRDGGIMSLVLRLKCLVRPLIDCYR